MVGLLAPEAALRQDTGDLKEEMILVCNALRNDLMHANECPASVFFALHGKLLSGGFRECKVKSFVQLCLFDGNRSRYVCGSTLRLLEMHFTDISFVHIGNRMAMPLAHLISVGVSFCSTRNLNESHHMFAAFIPYLRMMLS